MNKKILIMGLLAVFVLVSISFISSAETNVDVEKKESPLWRIRVGRTISNKVGTVLNNIKTRFLGERLCFLPLFWLADGSDVPIRELLGIKQIFNTQQAGWVSCVQTCYTFGCCP